MPWTWQYVDSTGAAVTGPNEMFGSQSDAESWIGQSWRELVESGVTSVRLVEDDRVEYQMSLQPENQ